MIDSQNVAYLYNGIWLVGNRSEALIHSTAWVTREKTIQWKKEDTKDPVVYDSIYVKCAAIGKPTQKVG